MMKIRLDTRKTGDDRKLAELILYISEKSEGDERFGATKLNKLLFFADFTAYWQSGQSITNQAYFRLPAGPGPRRLLPVRNKLLESGDLAISMRAYYGRTIKRPVALREPDLSIFKADEIAIVNDVIRYFWDMNAAEISDYSHRFIGWQLAGEEEDIPYEAAFISNRPLTESESDYALELLEEVD
jgi:hypothetical protein